jgi:hypothetical protein
MFFICSFEFKTLKMASFPYLKYSEKKVVNIYGAFNMESK